VTIQKTSPFSPFVTGVTRGVPLLCPVVSNKAVPRRPTPTRNPARAMRSMRRIQRKINQIDADSVRAPAQLRCVAGVTVRRDLARNRVCAAGQAFFEHPEKRACASSPLQRP